MGTTRAVPLIFHPRVRYGSLRGDTRLRPAATHPRNPSTMRIFPSQIMCRYTLHGISTDAVARHRKRSKFANDTRICANNAKHTTTPVNTFGIDATTYAELASINTKGAGYNGPEQCHKHGALAWDRRFVWSQPWGVRGIAYRDSMSCWICRGL